MSDIDPQLPYIQIHRSVGPKAAQLAAFLGVTYQHARGGLEVFWEGLADRRILSGRSELVLSADELESRLHLAFGVKVSLSAMVTLGILEPRTDGFRVRGMSRYLIAEANRQAKRGPRVPPQSHPSATEVPPQSDPSATQVPPQSDPTKARGERREVRGEREKKIPDPRHAPLVEELVVTFEQVRRTKYPFRPRDAAAVKALLATHEPPDIVSAWRKALAHQGYPSVSSLPELVTHLARFVGAGPPVKGADTYPDWSGTPGEREVAW